jgi:hypothetical protein
MSLIDQTLPNLAPTQRVDQFNVVMSAQQEIFALESHP